MAEGIGRDVVVDAEEWNTILGQLETKDKAVKEMLDKFIIALNILANDGFVQGSRKKNMETFRNEVSALRSQLDGIYESAKSSVDGLTSNAESTDKYISVFNLGG
ncbi:MAG: hypothetical protein ACI4JN_12835 [Ruminococcus sp.]